MQRSEENNGKHSKRKGRMNSSSKSSIKGKRKKLATSSSSDMWDDDRSYTSSDSSGLSTASTVVEDDRISSSSLRNKLPLECFNKSIGCTRYFYSYVDRNKHGKNCIFSFFKSCHEPDCREQVFIGTFSDYLEHAHLDHSVPLITAGNNQRFTVPMNVSDDFCNPSHSDRAFSTKVFAGFQQKTESEHFNLAMYALVNAISYGTPVMAVIPVVYDKNGQVYHFVRLKLALHVARSNEENQIPVIATTRHQSHLRNGGYQVCTCAFNTPEQIMGWMQSYRLVSYAIEDVKKANEMVVSVEFSRVRMKNEKTVKLKPYFLTWEEINLQPPSKLLVPDYEKEEPDPITAVLLPQLFDKQNILLEFIDEYQVIRLVIAQVLEQVKKQEVTMGTRKPKLMVLYPDDLSLAYEGRKLKEFIVRAGISATVIDSTIGDYVAKFEKCGTHIIITTPDAFHEFLQKKPGELEDLVFSSLQYIVFPHADHAKQQQNAKVIGEILSKLPDTKRTSIARLAITPFLDRGLVHLLKQPFFEKQYKALSVGESPAAKIRSMGVIDMPAKTLDEKIDQVVDLIVSGIGGRCIILANDLGHGYSAAYDMLMTRLENVFDVKKVSIVRTRNEAQSNPNAFDEFQLNPDGVLLTSYFILKFLDVSKLSDAIIIFNYPLPKTELARLTSIARKDNGTIKRIYNLNNNWSPNKITVDYFAD